MTLATLTPTGRQTFQTSTLPTVLMSARFGDDSNLFQFDDDISNYDDEDADC